MTPMWTDVALAVGSIGTFAVAVIGFPVLILQLRQIERATRGNTHSSLFAQSFETMKLIFGNPEFSPYIYADKELPQDDPHFFALKALVEIIADFLEHVALQKANLPKEVWMHWKEYIISMHRSCPLLREHFRQHADWYSESILMLFSDIDPKPEFTA